MQEVVDRVVHHLLLVGNGRQVNIVGNVLLEVSQFLVDLSTHLRHILSLLDLHREEQTLRAVAGDEGTLLRILVLHGRHILQSHIVAFAVRIDQRILHLVDLVQGMIHVDGRFVVVILHTTSRRHKTLASQHLGNRQVTDAVVRQLVAVDIDTDLVVLQSEHAHLTHALDHTQRVDEGVHIVIQFAVGLILRLHRQQQGGGVAEVIVHHDGQHTTGQLRLEALHAVLELRPELILVVQVVVQFHLNDTHAVL